MMVASPGSHYREMRTVLKLEIRNVSCGYAPEKVIVERCSFSVKEGEICCILGPNGVGKTTLFKTILQLQKPLAGQICLDGEDCAGWSPKKLAGYMAYVAQDHIPMFAYKVKDVVMMGRFGKMGYFAQPTDNDLEVVRNILDKMNLTSMMERQYTTLSGGERRMVMIARAVAQQPRFLILDEPTAGLDYRNSVMILQMIRKLADERMGVILTTHDPGHAFLCDSSALILAPGGTVAFGRADYVVTEENLRQAYGIPIRVVEFYDENNRVAHVCSPRIQIDQ